jgi:hypothetical protein
MTALCPRCHGARWVCATHLQRPRGDVEGACECGAVGTPCPKCNVSDDLADVPQMSLNTHRATMLRFKSTQPPACKLCARPMMHVAAMRAIRLHPLVFVYKCEACNDVIWVEPDGTSGRETAARDKGDRSG